MAANQLTCRAYFARVNDFTCKKVKSRDFILWKHSVDGAARKIFFFSLLERSNDYRFGCEISAQS